VTQELWRDTAVSGYGHGCDGQAEPWAGLRQVLLVRTTRYPLNNPQEAPTVEDHLWLTSLSPASSPGAPAELLRITREHWDIENGLHHKKDRVMLEDAQRRRVGSTMMSMLRSMAVGMQRFLSGTTTSDKETTVQSNLQGAVRLLNRIRFPRNGQALL
jgi:hypothetical protein